MTFARVSDAIAAKFRWLTVGVYSWVTLRPGSRPRRVANAIAINVIRFIQNHPVLYNLARSVLQRFPTLEKKTKAAVFHIETGLRGDQQWSWRPAPVVEAVEPYYFELVNLRLRNASARLQSASGSYPDSRTSAKPRLAYVSPLPPAKTGIANYSTDLLPTLSDHYDIDAIVLDDATETTLPEGCSAVRDAAWFEENALTYDRILYHMGNNRLHTPMLPLLEKYPGVVVLHDFYIGNLIGSLSLSKHWQGFWTYALQRSHGYESLEPRFDPDRRMEAIWKYPTNLFIFEQATGVICHSNVNRALTEQFYGRRASERLKIVPQLMELQTDADRKTARQELGLTDDDFLVCSFGFMGETKLNDELLDAWINSRFSDKKTCHLVFVGEGSFDSYFAGLKEKIAKHGAGSDIRITGFQPQDVYRRYIMAADIAVQLRTNSRGESSRSILDCMAYGTPCITNANGSFAELPQDSVLMLPDRFEVHELTAAIEALESDPGRRARQVQRANRFIAEELAPKKISRSYYDAIEDLTTAAPDSHKIRGLARAGEPLKTVREYHRDFIAKSRDLARQAAGHRPVRQLLFDVSAIARNDNKTGIERVVKAQLKGLLANPPEGFRIEPVWLADTDGRWRLRYARNFTLQLLGFPDGLLSDDLVSASEGDIYYAADYMTAAVIEAEKYGIFEKLKDNGARIVFQVYDNLPVLLPHFFPAAAMEPHAQWLGTVSRTADQIICISEHVKDTTVDWVKSNLSSDRGIDYRALHIGSDFMSTIPTTGLSETIEQLSGDLRKSPTFLMVGSIEPRKGHLQTLAAFNLLWEQGVAVNLVVVGRQAWRDLSDGQRRTIPEIVKAINSSPFLNTHLFWLNNASDQELERMYFIADCFIAASEDEGFGLPLVEAAQHELPILARDIPVFREVAGDHAYWFDGSSPEQMAKAIEDWLALHEKDLHPKSKDMPYITWAENVEALKKILTE